MMIFWAVGIGFLVMMGCTSLSKDQGLARVQMLPPVVEWNHSRDTKDVQSFLDHYVQENPSPEVQKWATYHEGLLWQQSDPGRACRAFGVLAEDKSFPLTDLAELRQKHTCPIKPESSLTWPQYQELVQKRPWLREVALETAEVSAQATDDVGEMIQVNLARLKLTPRAADREELLKKSIALAQKKGDTGQVKDLTSRLYALAPRLDPAPSENELLSVAKDFRQARQFEQARLLYQRVLKSKHSRDEDIYKALQGLRQTYKLEQNTDAYLKASLEVQKYAEKKWSKHRRDPAQTKRFHDAAVQYVRTIWTEGQVTEAVTQLAALEGKLKSRYPLDEIYWLRARVEEEASHFDVAVTWLEKALAQSPSKSPLREKLQWYLAWNYRKQKDFNQAAKLFEDLKNSTASPFEQAKYSFWLGRTLREKGDAVRSHVELKNLTQTDPIGYYGILAYRELQISFPSDKEIHRNLGSIERLAQQRSFAFENTYDFRYMEWLIAAGEGQVAANFLNQAAEKIARKQVREERVWSDLLQSYLRAGQFTDLFRIVGGLDTDLRTKLLGQNLEFLFPRPYFHVVAAASQRFGVSAELLYSIMRQESAFDPHARSPADAFGLLQLIPQAAQKAAETAGVSFHEAEDLYKPDINIPLGAAFLRRLLDIYKGQFILTVASYNASEKAIQTWLKSRLREDPIEFIEDIPYEETRAYVKLVLRNFVFYSRLTAPGQSIPFPEWCLANLGEFKL